MVKLLHGLKLPPPDQLAALAATVGPLERPDEAVCRAMRFFIRATVFLKSHQGKPLAELALAIGDVDLFLAAYAVRETGPDLCLEMDKKTDAIRRYLKKQGVNLKRAKSVYENLRDFLRATDMLVFLCSVKRQPPPPQGSLTDKSHQEAIERQARKAGWSKSDSELLAGFREKRSDGRRIYRVPQALLDCLVEFKKGRKHSGGVRSRYTAAG